jgi:hypothetical protein
VLCDLYVGPAAVTWVGKVIGLKGIGKSCSC